MSVKAKPNVKVSIDLEEDALREIIADWVTRNYGTVNPADIVFNMGKRTEGDQYNSYMVSYLESVTCKLQGLTTSATYRGLGDAEFGSK